MCSDSELALREVLLGLTQGAYITLPLPNHTPTSLPQRLWPALEHFFSRPLSIVWDSPLAIVAGVTVISVGALLYGLLWGACACEVSGA